MILKMMEGVLGKANFIYLQQYYYGKPFNRVLTLKKGKIESDKKLQKNIWLDMPRELLIASWG